MSKQQKKIFFIAINVILIMTCFWALYQKNWTEFAKYIVMLITLNFPNFKQISTLFLFFVLSQVACKSSAKVDISYHTNDTATYDALILTPHSSTQIPIGQVGMWADQVTGKPILQSADSTQYKVGEADRIKIGNCQRMTGTPSQMCFDQNLGQFFLWASNSWVRLPQDDNLIIHKSGTETITGRKTFLGGLNAPRIPSILAGEGIGVSGHVVPNVADDTFALLLASQQIKNKTIDGNYNTFLNVPFSGAVGNISDAQHGNRGGGSLHPLAIASGASGFMSGSDKAKLDGISSSAVSAYTVIYSSQTGNATFGAATVYLGPLGTAAAQVAQIPIGMAIRNGTIGKLFASIKTAPGGSDTATITIQKSSNQGASWSDTILTCPISASGVTCQDNTHNASVSAGDWFATKLVSSAGVAAGPATVGFELN